MGRSGVTVTLKKVSSASPNVSVSRTSGSSLKSKGSKSTTSVSPVKGLNLSALKSKISSFVALADTKLDELNTEQSKALKEIGRNVDLLLGTASYDEVIEHIEKSFKDYLPEADTVCAFFRGCMCDSIDHYTDEPGCSPHCAGNIVPNGSFKQCSQHVILLKDNGIDLRTNIDYGLTDKAYIYCDKSFEALDEKTINELKSLGINFVTIAVHNGRGKYKTIMTNAPLKSMMNKSKSFASQSGKSQSRQSGKSQSQQSGKSGSWDYIETGGSTETSSSEESQHSDHKKKSTSWSWAFIILAILLVIIIIAAAMWLMSGYVWGSSTPSGASESANTTVKEIIETEEVTVATKHYGPGVPLS